MWKFLNSPIVILLLGTAIVVGLYYLISPYQICLREGFAGPYYKKEMCRKQTSW